MKRVATAVVLIPIVLVIILRAALPVLAAVACVAALIGTRELLDLSTHYGVQPFRRPTYVFVVLLFVAVAMQGGQPPLLQAGRAISVLAFLSIIAVFAFLVIGMARKDLKTAFPAASCCVTAIAYVALPLALLVQLRELWVAGFPGSFLVVYLFVIVWTGDIAAYYTGRLVGRNKLAPRISPGKTWEGAVGSFIASLIVGSLFFGHALNVIIALTKVHLMGGEQKYIEIPALWSILLLSAAINVAAQLGDLAESLIKRGAGVKDSGNLLPGHGGMLDRIDALLLATPVLWCYAVWQLALS